MWSSAGSGRDPTLDGRTAQHRLAKLLAGKAPRVGHLVGEYWQRPLEEFAEQMMAPPPPARSAPACQAFDLLSRELDIEASRQLDTSQLSRVASDFSQLRCINAAVHSQLLTDPVSFYTHIFTLMGARRRGIRFVPFYLCSTVTLENGARFGPAWCDLGGERVRIVDLSRSRLQRTSVCARPSPRLLPESMDAASAQDQVGSPAALGDIRDALRAGTGRSLPEAFARANQVLLSRWDPAGHLRPVPLSDAFACRLLSRHIETGTLVARMVLDPETRDRVLGAQAATRRWDPAAFAPLSTELFWHLGQDRIQPLRVEDGWLRSVREPGLRIPLEASAIQAALEAGILIPDLFLIYAAASLVPRVNFLGGLRQLGYYPAFERWLAAALDPGNAEERQLSAELQWQCQGWGCRVIERLTSPLPALYQTEPHRGFAALVDALAGTALSHACQELTGFLTHKKWSVLLGPEHHDDRETPR
jgi:hypothetical protein